MAYARYNQNPRVYGNKQLGLNFCVQPAIIPGSQKSNEEACEKEQERQLLFILDKLDDLENHKTLVKLGRRLRRVEQNQAEVGTQVATKLQELEGLLQDLTLFTQSDLVPRIGTVEDGVQAIQNQLESGDIAQALEQAESQIADLQLSLSSLQDSHNLLEEGHEDEADDQDALEGKHSSLQANHDALQANHDALQTNHDALQTNHDTLQANYESLQQNHDELVSSFGELLGRFNSVFL